MYETDKNENKYMVILEKENKPGDYVVIFLNELDESFQDNGYLETIDSVTSKYTLEEFKNMIIKSNTVPEEYINGNLVIKGNTKHRHRLVFKDTLNNFSINNFILDNINDKDITNKLYLKYSSLSSNENFDNKEEFKNVYLSDNSDFEKTKSILEYIGMLPYYKQRMLYIYIIEKMLVKEKTKKLTKDLGNVA